MEAPEEGGGGGGCRELVCVFVFVFVKMICTCAKMSGRRNSRERAVWVWRLWEAAGRRLWGLRMTVHGFVVWAVVEAGACYHGRFWCMCPLSVVSVWVCPYKDGCACSRPRQYVLECPLRAGRLSRAVCAECIVCERRESGIFI